MTRYLFTLVFLVLWCSFNVCVWGATEDSAPKKDDSIKKTSSSGVKKETIKKPALRPAKKETLSPEEKEKARQAHFEKTGIWLWPELTPEDRKELGEVQKQYLQAVMKVYLSSKLKIYEREHFLVLTNMPHQLAQETGTYLEKMYVELSRMFGLPRGTQHWRGKCLVIIFLKKEEWMEYEKKFFNHTDIPSGASGLAHTASTGDVIISTFLGDVREMDARWKFLGMLVHETTHGFLHRYKSCSRMPLWLEEGLADWAAGTVVPADKQPGMKRALALKQMKSNPTLDGMMNEKPHLEAWQYGAASGLVEFLRRKKSDGPRQLIEMIKDGVEWKEAVQKVYKWTPEQMISAYGRALGVPSLKP